MGEIKCHACGTFIKIRENQSSVFCWKCGAKQNVIAEQPKPQRFHEAPSAGVSKGISGTSESMMKRGFMALEDGEWSRADEFFEAALNMDAEAGEAYLGKFLLKKRCSGLDEFFSKMEQESEAVLRKESVRMTEREDSDLVRHVNEQAKEKSVENYYDEGRIRELYQWSMQYESDYSERVRQKEKYLQPLEQDKDFKRAQKYLTGEKKEELSEAYTRVQRLFDERISKAERQDTEHKEALKKQYRDFVEEMDRFVEGESRKARERREEDYLLASEELKKAASIEDYQRILTVLKKTGDYKDSHSLSGQCMEGIQKLEELEEQERLRLEQEREQERLRLEQEKEQERLRKEQERLRLKQEKEEAKAQKQQERAQQKRGREPGQMMQEQEAPNMIAASEKKPVFAVLKWVAFVILLIGVDALVYLTLIQPSGSVNSSGKQSGETAVADSGQQNEEPDPGEGQEETGTQPEEEVEKRYQITLAESSVSLKYGQYYELPVTTDAPETETMVYSSNNEYVSVDRNGVIFAGAPGMEAAITVGLASGKADAVTYTVDVMSKEESFRATVETMNCGEIQTPSVSIYEKNTVRPEKDYTLQWDESLFYTLEDIDSTSDEDGLIDGYRIEKRLCINEETGNEIEYEVYCAPDTGIINKIVSIESFPDYVEITDYYYDDYGKINFIFQRKDSVYTPTYATRMKKGKRFYFNQDVLVKYRNITSPLNVTDIVLEKMEVDEIRYDSLSKKERKEYDRLWQKMLDASYNTYRMVIDTPSVAYISGYIFDQEGAPCPNAGIDITAEEYDYHIGQVKTNADGYYRVMVPTYDGDYQFQVTYPGCVDTLINRITADATVLDHFVENVYLIRDDGRYHEVELMIYDALNKKKDGMRPLGNVILYIREGMNNINGDIVSSYYTDYDGHVFVNLLSGAYTVQIQQEGYEDSYFNIFAGHDTFVQNGTSPVLEDDEVRIVLTWGQYPYDLDSHLFTPYQGANGDMQHIGYYNKTDDYGNNLDVDDTSSYGPETMTIRKLDSGTYKYFVADFGNCSDGDYHSEEMSYSGATVRVYTNNGLAGIFFVPYDRQGVIWEVFEIRNGRIIPVQRYYSNIEDKEWWHQSKDTYSYDEIDY